MGSVPGGGSGSPPTGRRASALPAGLARPISIASSWCLRTTVEVRDSSSPGAPLILKARVSGMVSTWSRSME